MGRMADARKRARQARAPRPPAPERPAPPPAAADDALAASESEAPVVTDLVFPDEAEAPAAGEPDAPAGWVARDEQIAFAPESAPSAPGRIALPSSGLAEEILARAEAAAVLPVEPVAAGPAPEPAPEARASNISFFATPVREQRDVAEATEHLVTFLLSAEEYGVDVRLVQEIIRVPGITPVPRAPGHIKGVINLRGRIIPVVDLKDKLGLGRLDESQRRARVVVVRLKGRLIGLLVDGASQVLKVPLSRIEAPPEEVVALEARAPEREERDVAPGASPGVRFIRGVAKLEKKLIILIDLHEILAPELRAAAAAGAAAS